MDLVSNKIYRSSCIGSHLRFMQVDLLKSLMTSAQESLQVKEKERIDLHYLRVFA